MLGDPHTVNFMPPQEIQLASLVWPQAAPLRIQVPSAALSAFQNNPSGRSQVLTASPSCSLNRTEGTYFMPLSPAFSSLHLPMVYEILQAPYRKP